MAKNIKEEEPRLTTFDLPTLERFFLEYIKRVYNQTSFKEAILLLIRKEKETINKFILNEQKRNEFERRMPKEMIKEWEDKIQKKPEIKK